MKKRNIFLVLLMSLLVILPFNVNAKEKIKEINRSEFYAGNIVSAKDTVKGIMFAAGQDVTITGTSEYGMYAGNSVSIEANVEKDLFAAGNTIKIIDAKIERDSYIAASSIKITDSNFNGDVKMAASSITLDNTIIDGNLVLNAQDIVLGENLTVTGTIKYNEDTHITGLDDNSFTTKLYKVETNEVTIREKISSLIISFVSIVIVGFAINLLLPEVFNRLNKSTQEFKIINILRSIFIGLLILIVVPIESIILMITIIGMPLSIITLIAYFMSMYLSTIFAGYVLGNKLLSKFNLKNPNTYISILVGTAIIYILSNIPYIGMIFRLLFTMLGIGYIFYVITKKNK